MAKRKFVRDLDMPIPWISALVIAAMALVVFVGVAHGDEEVGVSVMCVKTVDLHI